MFWLEQQQFPDMLTVTIVLDHYENVRSADAMRQVCLCNSKQECFHMQIG